MVADLAVGLTRHGHDADVYAAILVGAWIGGDLVFRHGWRVRPAEEAEIVEERSDDPAITAAFDEARRVVTDFERRKTFLPAS